jgi:hypothetical protein
MMARLAGLFCWSRPIDLYSPCWCAQRPSVCVALILNTLWEDAENQRKLPHGSEITAAELQGSFDGPAGDRYKGIVSASQREL